MTQPARPAKKATTNSVALIALGLALWLFGGLFAVYGPESNSFGVALGIAGIVALIAGVVLRLRA